MTDPSHAIGDDAARLRRVAFAVLRDEARADDVLQEAWILTLNKRPPERKDRDSWLRGVVRNLALNARREDRRRRLREQRASRRERVEPDTEAVDRRSVLEHLAASVEQLEEPLRAPVRLHYIEGHPVKHVASELGRPLSTVRDQLRRGLEVLRGRLTSEFGDRRAWGLALVGAFDWEAEEVHQALGSSLARTVSRYGLTAAGLVGASLLTIRIATSLGDESKPAPDLELSEDVANVEESRTPAAASVPLEELRIERTVAGHVASREVTALEPASEDPYAILNLRVVDGHGAPIQDARVRIRLPESPAYEQGGFEPGTFGSGAFELGPSDVDGWLPIAVPPKWLIETAGGNRAIQFNCIADGYALEWSYTVTLVRGDDLVVPIVLDNASCPITVRIRGMDGEPLIAEGLIMTSPGTESRTVEGPVERSDVRIGTDEIRSSEYQIPMSPCGSHELTTYVAGVGLTHVNVEVGTQREFEIQVGQARRVHGRVLSADGYPVPGALVRFEVEGLSYLPSSWSSVVSDATGAYSLWIGDEFGVRLVAEKPHEIGMATSVWVRYTSGRDEEVNLVFGQDSVVRIRLLDTNGMPLVGWGLYHLDKARRSSPSDTGVTTDEQGRAVLRLNGPAPVDVGVVWGRVWSGLPRWELPRLQPGSKEHEFVLDPNEVLEDAAIVGQLSAIDWEAQCSFELQLCDPRNAMSALFKLPCPGEEFAIEGLTPGVVDLFVNLFFDADDGLRMPLGTHTLTRNGFVDLGTIDLPRPVRVRFRPSGGAAVDRSNYRLIVGNGEGACRARLVVVLDWSDEPVELFPGAYVVQITSTVDREYEYWQAFEVPAQPEVTIELPL